MDFNNMIDRYRNGTATEQERLLVESEIEKFILLEELLNEDLSPAKTEEIPKDTDLQLVRRRISRRSVFQIAISILLTLSLLFGIVHIGIPAAESFYWTPDDSSFATEVSDLTILVDTYANLFCPDISITSVKGTRSGFATYDLELKYISANGYPDLSYGYGTLEKGTLSIPEHFWSTVAKKPAPQLPSGQIQLGTYCAAAEPVPGIYPRRSFRQLRGRHLNA